MKEDAYQAKVNTLADRGKILEAGEIYLANREGQLQAWADELHDVEYTLWVREVNLKAAK